MKIDELATKEKELYNKVIEIYNSKSKDDNELVLNDIYTQYKEIHNNYSKLASDNIEALKRALFIQWYSLSEPNYLTGISELNEKAEEIIIKRLKYLIEKNKIDSELKWMLNYYLTWDYIFDKYKSIYNFKKNNYKTSKIPENINKEKLENRGQMGMYWESILVK